MRAIVRNHTKTALLEVEKPVVQSPTDVLIRVVLSGLCRTDVYVADGLIKIDGAKVLGHEFSGVVEAVGDDVTHVNTGDRVTVMPILSCGTCGYCQVGNESLCQKTAMLGIDYHGSFAEYIVVPAGRVFALPDNVSFKRGAYSEPVAASLSVLKSGITPDQRGLILGDNRFGQLIYRILKIHGFDDVDITSIDSSVKPPVNTYDYVVETKACEQVMADAFYTVKPGGTVVLKSRRHELVGIHFNAAIRKELTLKAVNYADFNDTLALLARDDFYIDDLLGDICPLEDFKGVFEQSKKQETKKVFFAPDPTMIE